MRPPRSTPSTATWKGKRSCGCSSAASTPRGEGAESVAARLAAADLFADQGDAQMQHQVLNELAEFYTLTGRPEEAVPLLERCRAYSRSAAERGEDDGSEARAGVLLADVHRRAGRPEQAEVLARAALATWEARGGGWRAAEARHVLGMTLSDRDASPGEAAELLRTALAFFVPHARARAGLPEWQRFPDGSEGMIAEGIARLAALEAPSPAPKG